MTLSRLAPLVVLRSLLLIVVLGSTASPVLSQGLTDASGVAVFRYAEPGRATKAVQIWGAVRNAGVYQVERDTGLLSLLTLAGGPLVGVEDDRNVRSIQVRVIRDPSTARTVVLDTTLDALTTETVAIPSLEDGDLVTLTAQTRQRFTWRDALAVTASVASLAVLVLRIVE